MGTRGKRALIVVSSYNGVFYDDGKRTGLYWSEALHPYNVFKAAGFEVDVASETGEMGFDEHSIEGTGLDPESQAAWEDPNDPLKDALKDNLLKASDVDPSKYDVFFASGGHAAVFDFPKAAGLHDVASKVHAAGGVVAAVCHGPAILPGIKDCSSGQPLIKGKDVTGFTKQGEVDMGVMDAMDKNGVKTIEELVKEVGGRYVEPPGGAFDDFSIADGRIVSGVNPASAKSTAEKAIAALASA